MNGKDRPHESAIADSDIDAAGFASSFGRGLLDEEQKYGRHWAKRRRLISPSGSFPLWGTPAPMAPEERAAQSSEDGPHDTSTQANLPSPASPPSPVAPLAMSAGPSNTEDLEDDAALAPNAKSHVSPATPTLETTSHTVADNDALPPAQPTLGTTSHTVADDCAPPPSTSSSESDSPITTPAPAPAPTPKSNKRGWSPAEECALEESVRYVIEQQDGREKKVWEMWDLVAQRFETLHGFSKKPGACRSWWNRWLRSETGYDERKIPYQGQMITSAQGGKKSGI